MGYKWQERVLDDKLLELGPSYGNPEFRIISYLEFENAGRVHNVSVLVALESKLRREIDADNCVIHLISGMNLVNGQVSNLLVAIEGSEGVIYAADPVRIGIDDEIIKSRKAYKSGVAQKYIGLILGVLGVPLILAMIGGVMIAVGVSMWRNGESSRRKQASRIELLELQNKLVKNLPGVRFL